MHQTLSAIMSGYILQKMSNVFSKKLLNNTIKKLQFCLVIKFNEKSQKYSACVKIFSFHNFNK